MYWKDIVIAKLQKCSRLMREQAGANWQKQKRHCKNKSDHNKNFRQMNENDFEDFFKNKLLKYSSAVPVDMWQRIQQKKDKDSKVFFFKWSLAVLLLALLTAGYFILHTNKNLENKKTISSSNKKQNIETQNNSNKLSKDIIKRNTDSTLVNQTNKRIVPDKKLDNNKSNIYLDKSTNKKSKTSQYFLAKSTSSGKYISRQKFRISKHVITSGSFKDSVKIGINNASDSSNNVDIVKNYPDSTNNGKAIKMNPLPKDSSLKKEQNSLEKPSKKKSELIPQQKKWFLDVYASPDIPFNEITSGDANLADYIKSSYKMQVSYTAGVRLGKPIGKHFFVKTGFQYSQINTQFGNGNNMKVPNKFKSVDIPFLIGYNPGLADYTTAVNAGIIFNIYSWYKGISLDSNANVANIYKQNTGISLYIGWSFAKQLNNKIQIFAESYFRYHLSYMTKPQSTFNQKINTAGILFGLKYNFQKNRQQK